MTVEAFVLTMFKVRLPPYPLVHWAYGMMAPYQGDTSWNADFVYEGLRGDGAWESIDVDAYMPYGFGERNVRKFLRIYKGLGDAGHRQKFGEFALLLLDRERAHGREYRAVRVWFEQWPRSPAGYGYLHTPLFTARELVIQVQP